MTIPQLCVLFVGCWRRIANLSASVVPILFGINTFLPGWLICLSQNSLVHPLVSFDPFALQVPASLDILVSSGVFLLHVRRGLESLIRFQMVLRVRHDHRITFEKWSEQPGPFPKILTCRRRNWEFDSTTTVD